MKTFIPILDVMVMNLDLQMRTDEQDEYPLCVCVCAYVCVCVRACVRVCVCVCVW